MSPLSCAPLNLSLIIIHPVVGAGQAGNDFALQKDIVPRLSRPIVRVHGRDGAETRATVSAKYLPRRPARTGMEERRKIIGQTVYGWGQYHAQYDAGTG